MPRRILPVFGLGLLMAAPAGAVEIKSVAVAKATKAHLCRTLGGQGKDPVVTIKHEPKAGDRISVRMYDVASGRITEHGTKSVVSNASGTTVLEADFLAPCNVTNGRSNSSYRFDVTSKGSKKVTRRWFDFNSGTKQIR